MPVIQFPGNGDSLINQVRDLAASLDLQWDEEAARAFFDETLIRNRSPLRDSSPTYDLLVESARYPNRVPTTNLGSLKLNSEPEWPLETHLGVRFVQQRNQLWEMAQFSTDPHPDVVEILLEGARLGGPSRLGVTLHQVEVKSPLAVGAVIMNNGLRPHGVVGHGLLAGRAPSDIEYFFQSIYLTTDPLAEVVIDVPDPRGDGLLSATPVPVDRPRPAQIEEIATQTGWDHIVTQHLSPGRSGMFFRKRILTDSELIPVVTDVIAGLQRIHAIEAQLSSTLLRSDQTVDDQIPGTLEAERKRADDAERALDRLRNRRSVKVALSISQFFRPMFRRVRSWKKRSSPES